MQKSQKLAIYQAFTIEFYGKVCSKIITPLNLHQRSNTSGSWLENSIRIILINATTLFFIDRVILITKPTMKVNTRQKLFQPDIETQNKSQISGTLVGFFSTTYGLLV